ncbi:MAG TPA: aminofutalosine synthase MqnE [Flavobacteriales bacterium]|nr:aminofutalosine synthase MqnE [Flavobacteriales bacterium]HIL66823.1 aminofutalosine synthase MqnE [Flavobacteriales bacterium]
MKSSCISAELLPENLVSIVEKIENQKRISDKEALFLFENGSVSLLGTLANQIRERLHGNKTYFNKNIHIEPTNICVFDCKFCSYSRLLSKKEEAWEYSEKDMLEILNNAPKDITEVHIVGGVHPKMGLDFFANLIKEIKKLRPDIHVKAFTAVELEYICRKAKVSYKEGLQILKNAGQDSLPGGGAEIFDEEIRKEICEDKCSTAEWLEIHEAAHSLGMPSNATILYGHIEKPKHIINHMSRLRSLQDKTGGFNAFIPLKFRNKNNQMSHLEEASTITDMRMYAIARIYLDNFKHIKAYWPMIGKESAQTLLAFGVNDIDGTIDDTTKIYSMAGAKDQNPKMTTEEIVALIKQVKRQPIERDTLYNTMKDYV